MSATAEAPSFEAFLLSGLVRTVQHLAGEPTRSPLAPPPSKLTQPRCYPCRKYQAHSRCYEGACDCPCNSARKLA